MSKFEKIRIGDTQKCWNCYCTLPFPSKLTKSGYPKGEFVIECPSCKMKIFYDINKRNSAGHFTKIDLDKYL